MSSGFVSGGTADNETERDSEWKRAAQELEDQRRAKEDLAKQHDGKSLYEILQANKDKKQAEFEERARFKLHNALDDDEADYLDSVLEKKRKEEANVRKETLEQLELFRRQQEEAESKIVDTESTEAPREDGGQWAAVRRKRKKGNDAGLLKGVKLRKLSSATEERQVMDKSRDEQDSTTEATTKSLAKATDEIARGKPELSATETTRASSALLPAKSSNTLSLGLGYVSSDDD
ncbi:Nn.00g015890.m01.CDS01 [Neocucurbitaria sp. VM-36]